MKELIKNATSNEIANTTNNTNVTNETDSIMCRNQIDFSSVCGEGIVTQTAKVEQQVVNDLFQAFLEIPQEVVVSFKNNSGYLRMVVKMNHREKFFRTYETDADAKLVECMLGAMRGNMIGALDGYNSKEHILEISDIDPRIDLFRQFINSPLRCHFETDFIAGNGDRYISAIFNISYRKQVKFCLKRTEEIETIIHEALKVA